MSMLPELEACEKSPTETVLEVGFGCELDVISGVVLISVIIGLVNGLCTLDCDAVEDEVSTFIVIELDDLMEESCGVPEPSTIEDTEDEIKFTELVLSNPTEELDELVEFPGLEEMEENWSVELELDAPIDDVCKTRELLIADNEVGEIRAMDSELENEREVTNEDANAVELEIAAVEDGLEVEPEDKELDELKLDKLLLETCKVNDISILEIDNSNELVKLLLIIGDDDWKDGAAGI
jgi:hypothetical protein